MQESGEKTGEGRLKRGRTSHDSSTKKEEVTTAGYGVNLRRSKRSVTAAKKEQEVKRDVAGGDGEPLEQNLDLDVKPMEVKPIKQMVSISSLDPCITDSKAKLGTPSETLTAPLNDDNSLEAGGSQYPQRGELEIKGDEPQDVLMEGIIDHEKDLSSAIDESQNVSMEGIIDHGNDLNNAINESQYVSMEVIIDREKDLSNAIEQDSLIRGLVTTEENKGNVTEQRSNEVLEAHLLQELGDGDASRQLPDEPDVVPLDLEIKNLSNVVDEDSPIKGLETPKPRSHESPAHVPGTLAPGTHTSALRRNAETSVIQESGEKTGAGPLKRRRASLYSSTKKEEVTTVGFGVNLRRSKRSVTAAKKEQEAKRDIAGGDGNPSEQNHDLDVILASNRMVSNSSLHLCTTVSEAKLKMPNETPSLPQDDDDKSLKAGGSQCPPRGVLVIKGDEPQDVPMEGIIDHEKDLSSVIDESQNVSMEGIIDHGNDSNNAIDKSQYASMEAIIDCEKDLSNAIDKDSPIGGLVTTEENKVKVTEQGSNEVLEAHLLQDLGDGDSSHQLPDKPDIVPIDLEIKNLSNVMDEDSPIGGLKTTEGNKGKVAEQGSNEAMETHLLQELGDGDSSDQLPDEPEIMLVDLEIKNVLPSSPPQPQELEFHSPDSSSDFSGSHPAKGNDVHIVNQMPVEPKTTTEAATCSRHRQISSVDDETNDDNIGEMEETVPVHLSAELGDQKLREPEGLNLEVEPKCTIETASCSSHCQNSSLETNLDCGDSIDEPIPHHELNDETKENNLIEMEKMVHLSLRLEANAANEDRLISNQMLGKPVSISLEAAPSSLHKVLYSDSSSGAAVSPANATNEDRRISNQMPGKPVSINLEATPSSPKKAFYTDSSSAAAISPANATNEDRLISNQMPGKPVSVSLKAAPSSPPKAFYSVSSSGAAISPANAANEDMLISSQRLRKPVSISREAAPSSPQKAFYSVSSSGAAISPANDANEDMLISNRTLRKPVSMSLEAEPSSPQKAFYSDSRSGAAICPANATNENRRISNQMLGKPVSVSLEAAASSPQKAFHSSSSSVAAISPAKATDLMNCDTHLDSKISSDTSASAGNIDNVLIGKPENTLEATFCSLDSINVSSESGIPSNQPASQTIREESNMMDTSEGVCSSNLLTREVEDKAKLVANKPSQNVHYSRLSMRKLRELYKAKAIISKKKNKELTYSGLSMRKLRALYREKASNKEQQG